MGDHVPRSEMVEYVTMRAAHHCGLDVDQVELTEVGGVTATVVKRYDRVLLPDGTVGRIHQEDLVQALSVMPEKKYHPGAVDVARVLRKVGNPDESIDRFVSALAFNVAIRGTDAHAKNYSLMIFPDGWTTLAPLYDLISAAPYPQVDQRLAMGVGGQREFPRIGESNWVRYAKAADLDTDRVLALVNDINRRVPDALAAALNDVPKSARANPEMRALAQFGAQLPKVRQTSAVTGTHEPDTDAAEAKNLVPQPRDRRGRWPDPGKQESRVDI